MVLIHKVSIDTSIDGRGTPTVAFFSTLRAATELHSKAKAEHTRYGSVFLSSCPLFDNIEDYTNFTTGIIANHAMEKLTGVEIEALKKSFQAGTFK
jgi:hypothetical protein